MAKSDDVKVPEVMEDVKVPETNVESMVSIPQDKLEEIMERLAELENMKVKGNISVSTQGSAPLSEIEAHLNEEVPFYAFRDNDKYKDDLCVGINGKNWIIQRGITVMIPRYVKNVLEDSARQDVASAKHSQGLIENFVSKTREFGMNE